MNYKTYYGLIALVAASPAAAQYASTQPAGREDAASRDIVVTGERSASYAPPDTKVATKTDTPLLEVPQSVQVITRQLLDDQASFALQDATQNVAGVQPAFSFLGISNSCVRVRGFSTEQGTVGCTYYRDGVRVWAQPLPFSSIEAIEVVKGPDTVLFGRNEPGGLVNVVTKAPTPDFVARVQEVAGSYGTSITSIDIGGALNGARTLSARLNAAYSTTDTFRRGVFDRLADVNLALGWVPDDRTHLTVTVDLTRDTYRPDAGVPALGDRPAPVSVRQSYAQNYIDSRTDAIVTQLTATRRLGTDWQLRGNIFFSYQRPEYFFVYGSNLDDLTLKYPVYYFAEQYSWRRTWQGNLDLTGTVRTGRVKHKLLFGLDYNNERYNGPIFYASGSDVGSPDLDLFNPALGSAARVYPTRADFSPYGSVQKWIGVYAQDQISLTDTLIVNAGLRFDSARGAFSPDPVADAFTENAVNPRVGVVWLPRAGLSLYAQYQTAFGPNNGRSSSGAQFPGQTARQYEVGTKWQSPGKQFLATIALFDLTKKRLLTADLTTPDPYDSAAIGAVRNRGIEVDISGKLTDRLSTIASYAYSDAVVTKDASGYQGHAYEGVPRNAGSLWLRYQATSALAVGGGVYAEGDRPGDLANDFTLPAYARVDMLGQYRLPLRGLRWTAQVNVTNLLNKRYFAGVFRNSRDFILPGSSRAVLFTLRAEVGHS